MCLRCEAGERRVQARRWLNEVALSLVAHVPIRAAALVEQAGNLWASAFPLDSSLTH
jgi:hypothetical protein